MPHPLESALGTQNIAFVEELYESYLRDPASVSADWRDYFSSLGPAPRGVSFGPSFAVRGVFDGGAPPARANGHAVSPASASASASAPVPPSRVVPPVVSSPPLALRADAAPEPEVRIEDLAATQLRLPPVGSLRPVSAVDGLDIAIRQDRVDQLIRAYRARGHMIAKIDPLGMPREATPELDPKFYHLTDADLDRRFPGLRFRIIDEQDQVRRHVKVFVNLDSIEDLSTPVSASDELHILGALSGG